MANALNSGLSQQIYNEAISQGVPPEIALAVAQQESGVAQYTSSGDLVTGSAGEIGAFQLMPMTAAGLGVDPTDPNQNVSGGISLLAQLYQQYGNWPQALSAYNSGSPNGSPSYAASVLNIAGGISLPTVDTADDDSDDSGDLGLSIDPNVLIIGGIALVGLAVWWID